MELIDEVRPFTGARRLIDALGARGHAVVLASSAKPHEIDHYLDLLDARAAVDGWTTAADVEKTKPHPDLVVAAVEKAGGGDAPDPAGEKAGRRQAPGGLGWGPAGPPPWPDRPRAVS